MKLNVKKTVNVTSQSILKGKPLEEACPVALAIIKEFKLNKYEFISVGSNSIYISDAFTLKTPKEVKKFINTFDDCFDSDGNLIDKKKLKELKPFKFTLDL